MGNREIEDAFPNLYGSGYEITSEPSREYNCTAWALGITSQRWDCDRPESYWPPSLPRDSRVATLLRLFSDEGYSLCDDDALEPGYEKIAIYAFVGQFTHVARQLEDGRWTSKLGNREVITHPSPTSLSRVYTATSTASCAARLPPPDLTSPTQANGGAPPCAPNRALPSRAPSSPLPPPAPAAASSGPPMPQRLSPQRSETPAPQSRPGRKAAAHLRRTSPRRPR